MKRLALLVIALGAVAAAPAYASNPNHPVGCHGANNVPCRPDPQPTHGNDCQHSDDHSCEVSTSTTSTTQPPSTTTTTVTTSPKFTTTTEPVASASPTTTTTQSSPTTTTASTTPETGAPPVGTTSLDSATTDQLPATGAASKVLAIFGLWFIVGGAVAMLVGKIIKGSSNG